MTRISSLSLLSLLFLLAVDLTEGLEKHLPFSISKSTERVVLLFHDDSPRSKNMLSELQMVQNHFEELDRQQQQQQQQQSSLTNMVSFVTVNATDTPHDENAAGKELAKDYMISFFPTIKWVVHGVTCDFLGGRRSKFMIQWIQARLDSAVVFLEHSHHENDDKDDNDDPIFEQQLADAKGDADVAIVGFFPSLNDIPPDPWSPLSIFVAVAQEDRGVKCRFLAIQDTPQTRQKVLGHEPQQQPPQQQPPSSMVYAIHRHYHEEQEPIPFQYESSPPHHGFGRVGLHHFVEKHKVPLLLPIYSQSTSTSIFEHAKHQHLVLVFCHSVQSSQEFLKRVVEPVAHEFQNHEDPRLKIEHVRFVVAPYIVGDEASATLWQFFQMSPADTENLPTFVLFDLHQPNDGIYVNKDKYMHKYVEPEEGYTKEGLKQYVKLFIHLYDGSIRYHQLDHPQPEPKPLGVDYIDDGFNQN